MTDDLVTVRGLVDSDFDMPARSFDGKFAGYEQRTIKYGSGGEGTIVDLNFADVDNVICALGSVYNLPTITLGVGQSNKHKSRWGYFGDSLAALLGDDEDLKDCDGRVFSMVFCDGQDGRPAPKPIWNRDADTEKHPDKMVPTAVWIVTAVDGAGAPSAATAPDDGQTNAEYAEELLVGKTRGDFNKAGLADPRLRKDTGLQRSIVDKSFITSLVQLGKVTEDGDGVFQRVASES